MQINSNRLAPTSSEWTDAFFERWWQRMGEIFGRAWVEQYGSKAPESWKEEMRTWSVNLAASVLVHYRRDGRRFPPNLSEVGKLAQELRSGLQAPQSTATHRDPLSIARQRAKHDQEDSEWIDGYRKEHPGATFREAAIALLHKRGQTTAVPAHIIAQEQHKEAKRLQAEATKAVAKARDIESETEDTEERAAIQSETGT